MFAFRRQPRRFKGEPASTSPGRAFGLEGFFAGRIRPIESQLFFALVFARHQRIDEHDLFL